MLHDARTHKTLTSGISWRVQILETARIRMTALMMISPRIRVTAVMTMLPIMGDVQPTIISNV